VSARAAMRDASQLRRPGTASKYHVVSDDMGAWSACGASPLVLETVSLPAGDVTLDAALVPPGLRCRRKGCRERWP
jgi:hypothetical protein